MIVGAIASAGVSMAGTSKVHSESKDENVIERWIVPHGGDCCGCIVPQGSSQQRYVFMCNDYGEQADVMVSETVYNRMAEALQRALHVMSFAHGHEAHDGKPEHSYTLDFAKELRFIEETWKTANVEPRG
jgi:hypothetical protein